MNITEKVAYVRGLAEGLDLDDNKKEVRVIKELLEVIDDMALTLSDIEDGYNDVCAQLDAVDEDLYALEQDLFDEDDEDEDIFYEVTCPICGETTCLSEDILLRGGIDCPNCGESLEFDFDNICNCDNEYGDDCGCDNECDDDCDCGCKD